MDAYATACYSACLAQGITRRQFRAMGYAQVAELSGVVLEPGGDSPSDFFWQATWGHVLAAYRRDRRAARRSNVQAALETRLRTMAGYANARMAFDEEGRLGISDADDGEM